MNLCPRLGRILAPSHSGILGPGPSPTRDSGTRGALTFFLARGEAIGGDQALLRGRSHKKPPEDPPQ